MSAREVERLKREEAGGSAPVKTKAPKVETYEWTNRQTGEVQRIPKGIDPGWDYNVGKAAYGQRLSDEVMEAWKRQGAKSWERLTPGDWESYGRPERPPLDAAGKTPDYSIPQTREAIRSKLQDIFGGDEKAFSFQRGTFRYDILANADVLARHMDLNRAPFLPLLPETLDDPNEVWLSFERHRGTGRIVLRMRAIKWVDTGDGMGMTVAFQAVDGKMEAWTVVPSTDLKYLNNQRVGKLIYM